MEDRAIVEDALALAEIGLAVFPVHGINANGGCTCGNRACDNPGKHPRIGGGFHEASVNVRTIRGWFTRWPDSNIGIATGEKSGVVVLDVDGPLALEALDGRPMPETPSVATGRADGGTHYYFAWPGYAVKNLQKAEGMKGLDFRGDGGYVVAPPSRHVSGNSYRWLERPDGLSEDAEGLAFAEAPQWLEKLWQKKPSEGEESGDDTSGPRMIGEGMRDVTLTEMAGSMRRKGFTTDTIRMALLDHNAKYCIPPLSEDQVTKIAESIGRKRAETPKLSVKVYDDLLGEIGSSDMARDAKLSDVGNAEVFIDLYGDRFRYDYARRRWMVWVDGAGVWREDNSGYAERAFMSTLRIRDVAANTIVSDELRKALRAWVSKSESQNGIPNGLKRASTLKGVPIDTVEFDKIPTVVNCLNGTLNLDTAEFTEASSADFCSKQATVFYDREAKAPQWETFIEEIFDGDTGLISYFQRALGYSLTGLTKEQALFICHGNGANGKSTALNTISRVMGSYASATPFDTFEADNRNQYGNDLAALKGKRYVIASESEASRRLAEARVKLVTGQDPISCRFLYGEYFEYIPNFKVWLAVNHKPVIRGTDHGIWRRIHLIPFTQTFGPGGRPMDKDLDLKLAEELPGILNWMITGYSYWKEFGLNPPESVQAATTEYKRENDSIGAWLDDRTSEDAGGKVPATQAYTDFRNYMAEIGEVERAIPTMKTWSIGMAEKGIQKKRAASGWEYLGIKLGTLKVSERGN